MPHAWLELLLLAIRRLHATQNLHRNSAHRPDGRDSDGADAYAVERVGDDRTGTGETIPWALKFGYDRSELGEYPGIVG